jgi:hypothetical protein
VGSTLAGYGAGFLFPRAESLVTLRARSNRARRGRDRKG